MPKTSPKKALGKTIAASNTELSVHIFLIITIVLLFAFLVTTVVMRVLPVESRDNDLGAFCGTSTEELCSSSSGCVAGGCSGQVCQSSSAQPTITTCEYKDCFNASAFGVSCKCVQNKCMWAK